MQNLQLQLLLLTFDGPNGAGKAVIPRFSGATTKADKTNLSNGDLVTITYKLELTYAWLDGTRGNVTLQFTVGGLKTGVAIPTNQSKPLTFTGLNGKATFTMPTLEGTTVTADKQTNLSNGDSVKITYTLNTGYIWSDNSKEDVVLTFTVEGVNVGVARPTNAAVPVDFYGSVGKGTYKLPKYKNTAVTIKKGGSGTTPATNLNTDDTVILTFTPNKGYAWNTGDNTPIELTYNVGTLPKAPDGTVLTAANLGTYTTYDGESGEMIVWEGCNKYKWWRL